jgi:hypothetical protein
MADWGVAALPVDLIPCHVMTSRLRAQLAPLRNQSDFIEVMWQVRNDDKAGSASFLFGPASFKWQT